MTQTRPAPVAEPVAEPDQPEILNQLARTVLAIVPLLTVALAAVGSATGGLARLFRDQTSTALAAILLILLSFALATLSARLPVDTPAARAQAGRRRLDRTAVKALLLILSTALFFVGAGWAFSAQIVVMGGGQAPIVTGEVKSTATGDVLTARVQVSGVKSRDRVVVYVFESADSNGDANSRTAPPVYQSKTGPNPDGVVDVPVVAELLPERRSAYPYVFITAVLGELSRDCDGALIVPVGDDRPRPNETACLTLLKPAIPEPVAATASARPVR